MQKFSIKSWSAWDLTENQSFADYQPIKTGQPVLADIKPLVKRRMPKLAKAMHELSNAEQQMPCVYASKNAELSRTIKIIRQFGGDLSPALFSMSVHNAIPGLLSVINHDDSPYTVIDSMSGVLEVAVLEAVSLLDQYETVKVVYFEEHTVEEFLSLNSHPDCAVVMQMIIGKGGEFSLHSEPNVQVNNPKLPSNASIKKCFSLFQGDISNLVSTYARNSWHWNKC